MIIKNSKDVFVFADKTTNLYPVSKENYKKILKENVTKNYKKAKSGICNEINEEAADMAVDLKLENRMECYTQNQAFNSSKTTKKIF